MKIISKFFLVLLISLTFTSIVNAQVRPGYYGMIEDFEGSSSIWPFPTKVCSVFTAQQSTLNNITEDEYGTPVGLIIDVSDAPSGYGVAHLQVTLKGEDYPLAGFGFFLEHDETISYISEIDQKEYGGKVAYDYRDIGLISFWTKGSGPWYFQLKSLAYVGLPSPQRYDEVDIPINVSPNWSQTTIGKSLLVASNWSGVAPSQEEILAQVVGVDFVAKQSSSTGTDAEIFVDAVKFLELTTSSHASSKVSEVTLSDATPNPFNPVTNISFNLVSEQKATLNVYDAKGNLVNTLYNGIGNAGVNNVSWNGTDASGSQVASGVYFYRLTTGSKTLTKSMILMK